ncbi:MAG: relaxase/mobilization nuclease domain-containing protein [Clostridiales bacterium]|nr:relaxase/mobilization nuclease domain-containing protein [Clostridiales bacterium]
MAATRIIPLHINKGKTIAKTLADRTDYSQNGKKTEDGKYISAYECDPKTVDEDFMLSKRQYEHSTGRHQKNDVIAYQIRQSFKPGEVTPEEANRIGYELAMSFTKGKHAFIVATHTDRPHIHNHIVFNSTTLDGSRKFHNFYLSFMAVRRISDRLCVKNGLSIIEARPYREQQKRTTYPKKATHRDAIITAIDTALQQKPKDFEALLKLLSDAGYEIKRGKNISLKGKGQKRFIRLRSLGDGYSEEDLRAVLAGTKEHQPRKRARGAKEKSFADTQPKLQLLIDIQEKMEQGKGAGYARWAKTFNLKQMAEAVCFIKEQGVDTFEELSEKTETAVTRFNELSDSIKASESRLSEIAALKKHIINYSRTRDAYTAYRKAGYSKKFLEEHREEIALHKAAKAAFDQLDTSEAFSRSQKGSAKKKIPTIKQLNQEYAQVLADKKKAYAEYRTARKTMQDLLIARKTVETILEVDHTKMEQKKEEQTL